MADSLSLTVVVGTYDGVLAGWDYGGTSDIDSPQFKISFATPVHGGSVRGLALAGTAASPSAASSTLLLSCGYDEYLQTHDFRRKLTSSGQIRTPSDMGTPVCASFGPPYRPPVPQEEAQATPPSSHCIVGFASGKMVIYKKRDWSVQHVLQGHQGGIGAMGVHPSGKLALTGGVSDGKIKCWDLTKGRLAYASKITPKQSQIRGRVAYDSIVSLVWNSDGTAYAFSHGSHVTVRDVATGKNLLDVELPCRANQVCLLDLPEGLFLAVAGNDGSLPVLAVGADPDDKHARVRRAMMAIEPVDDVVAGEERYKCIQTVQPGTPHVVTANSAGVVSLLNLQGAINMLMSEEEENDDEDGDPRPEDDGSDSDSNSEGQSDKDDDSSDGEEDLAVEFLDSIQLGSGSRITCMAVFCSAPKEMEENSDNEEIDGAPAEDENDENRTKEEIGSPAPGLKRKREVAMDPEAMDRARELVSKAKKIQKKDEKRRKKQKSGR